MPRDDNAFSGRDFDIADTPGRHVNFAAARGASAMSTGAALMHAPKSLKEQGDAVVTRFVH